jgi:very-short-patch-repair endonuclease
MKKEMFYGAGSTIFQNAKELRKQPTDAERVMWMHLRTRPKGYKFRRQHPSVNFILDFYCHSSKLAIEADGSIHEGELEKAMDHERQSMLEKDGIKFLRFTNQEIMQDFTEVIKKTDEVIDKWSIDISQ